MQNLQKLLIVHVWPPCDISSARRPDDEIWQQHEKRHRRSQINGAHREEINWDVLARRSFFSTQRGELSWEIPRTKKKKKHTGLPRHVC